MEKRITNSQKSGEAWREQREGIAIGREENTHVGFDGSLAVQQLPVRRRHHRRRPHPPCPPQITNRRRHPTWTQGTPNPRGFSLTGGSVNPRGISPEIRESRRRPRRRRGFLFFSLEKEKHETVTCYRILPL